MTREEALQIARSLAAAAFALHGSSDDYCQYVRGGSFDADPCVQAALAALVLDEHRLSARLAEIRGKSNVVEIAA